MHIQQLEYTTAAVSTNPPTCGYKGHAIKVMPGARTRACVCLNMLYRLSKQCPVRHSLASATKTLTAEQACLCVFMQAAAPHPPTLPAASYSAHRLADTQEPERGMREPPWHCAAQDSQVNKALPKHHTQPSGGSSLFQAAALAAPCQHDALTTLCEQQNMPFSVCLSFSLPLSCCLSGVERVQWPNATCTARASL